MEEFSASTDQTIVKGKRTKRPRQSSSASSSGSAISTCTEEDEDMAAKCLILLARSGVGNSPPPRPEHKFRSRKFTELITTTTITNNDDNNNNNQGKIGIYVYECKTCNRTFPSFQALGGHRASHKKPKPTPTVTNTTFASGYKIAPVNQEKEEKYCTTIPQPHSMKNNTFPHENKTSKIHECSICGSEFASGQALGGHMRRHRPAVANTNNNGTRIVTNNIDNDSSSTHDVRSVMSLDLNLPAPAEEEDCPEAAASFHQFSFSAAALVDCHY